MIKRKGKTKINKKEKLKNKRKSKRRKNKKQKVGLTREWRDTLRAHHKDVRVTRPLFYLYLLMRT